MKTVFIGDVHGMLEALDQLIEAVELCSGDHLVFLGDLVDKGPDPLGVVRRVGELQTRDDIKVTLIRGNHEDKHLRYRINREVRPKIAREQESKRQHSPGCAGFMIRQRRKIGLFSTNRCRS